MPPQIAGQIDKTGLGRSHFDKNQWVGQMVDDQSHMMEQIHALPFWSGEIAIEPIKGGITNLNFCVTDANGKHFVRLGADIPVHGVMRFNEYAASVAAAACSLSPALLYSAPGILVFEWIEGRALKADDLKSRDMIARVVPLLKKCHEEVPKYLRGPILTFWVFHVIRDYIATLRESNSPYVDEFNRFLMISEELEKGVGEIRLVFGQNDLLPANIIDDGARLWLIDWDYAGFNSPLFDLANLATNAGFDEGEENHLLELYYGNKPNRPLRQQFLAMSAASALRETLWSMVSELRSTLDVDFAAYTSENRQRFEMAFLRYDFY
jgi:thiamine kinase-like enzyme